MISTQSKYALKAAAYLASRPSQEEFVQTKVISEAAGIPPAFLAKIVKMLANRQIVETKKGIMGGVRLRSLEFSFLEICIAMDDPLTSSRCFMGRNECSATHPCRLHHEWSATKKEVIRFLNETKLVSKSPEENE